MDKLIYLTTIIIVLFMSLAAFCEIPYLNSYFIIIMGTLLIVIINFCKRKFIIPKFIKGYTKVSTINGIDIYSIPYKQMGNHNVAIIQGKDNCILIEEGVMQTLNDKEKEAVFYHELGHLHSISQQTIFLMQCCAVIFSECGLHANLYGDRYRYYIAVIGIVIGVIMICLVEWIKKYVEYSADKYSIMAGCEKEDLISAISKIECMNNKNGRKINIKISGHPKLENRIKRIMSL